MITLNGKAVLSGSVTIPLSGLPSAWLLVDTGEPISPAPRAAKLDLGGMVLSMTVLDQGAYASVLSVRLVGGAGGLMGFGKLSKNVTAKSYRVVPARIPIVDTLTEAGELLASSSAAGALGVSLPHWSRPAGLASGAFAALMRGVGATWRALADGSIWIGTDTWPKAKIQGEVLEELPGARMRLVAPEVADILPGTTVDDFRIEAVDYRFDEHSFRAEVSYQ